MNEFAIAMEYLTSSLGYSVLGFIIGFIIGRLTSKFDILVVQWFRNHKEKRSSP